MGYPPPPQRPSTVTFGTIFWAVFLALWAFVASAIAAWIMLALLFYEWFEDAVNDSVETLLPPL